MTDAYTLDTAGLNYTADILAPSFSQVQAFTAGKLLRRVAGVSGGISALRNAGVILDFALSNGGFTNIDSNVPQRGVYNDPPGMWGAQTAGTLQDTIHIQKTVSSTAFTAIEVWVDAEPGATILVKLDSTTVINTTRTEATGTMVAYTWTGSVTATAIEIKLTKPTPVSYSSRTSRVAYNHQSSILYSDDNGATLTNTIEAGLNPTTCHCFDVDDYAAGVFVVGAGTAIHYTDSYSDASSTLLSGLTGLDDTAKVVCIRIPYLKLATQADNDTATSMQFIYGVDTAVSGKTLWGITFNASTGAIIAESDMTPIISATTYRLISQPNSLSTFGGNTQILAALVTSGGATRLIVSSNGGTNWTDRGALAATSVEFVPPIHSGTGAQLLFGTTTGGLRSDNFGVSFTSTEGDINTETGSRVAIKVIAI